MVHHSSQIPLRPCHQLWPKSHCASGSKTQFSFLGRTALGWIWLRAKLSGLQRCNKSECRGDTGWCDKAQREQSSCPACAHGCEGSEPAHTPHHPHITSWSQPHSIRPTGVCLQLLSMHSLGTVSWCGQAAVLPFPLHSCPARPSQLGFTA